MPPWDYLLSLTFIMQSLSQKMPFHKGFLRLVYNRPNGTRCLTSTCTEKDENLYDVIVSGGGMVGATMAASLGYEQAFHDRRILLLETAPQKSFSLPEKYNSRVVAVSPATVQLMTRIGAWEAIEKMRVQPVKGMQVWDSCSDSIITFNADTEQPLAHIVENDVLSAAVTSQLESVKYNVQVKYSCKAKGYTHCRAQGASTHKGHLQQVHLVDGTTLYTKLLIGADGFNSLVRKSANIHSVEWGYNQHAVVSILKLSEQTDNNIAWQRFLTTGPIAMLPLSPDYRCLIWSTTSEDARQLCKLPEEAFVDAVNHAFWSDVKKNPTVNYAIQLFDGVLTSLGYHGSSHQQLPPSVIGAESRAMFPLGLCHATQYVWPRLALIGDAAHRVHPLGGQGVNLGFGDVACLRDKLVAAVENGLDIGSLVHLLEYESERQRHNVPVMATMDGLHRLYATSATPLVLLRSLGLQATNALTPIKDLLKRGAAS